MNESITEGLVVGVGPPAVGAVVGHCLGLREMKARWGKDDRKE
jgi:hypothetical protein